MGAQPAAVHHRLSSSALAGACRHSRGCGAGWFSPWRVRSEETPARNAGRGNCSEHANAVAACGRNIVVSFVSPSNGQAEVGGPLGTRRAMTLAQVLALA